MSYLSTQQWVLVNSLRGTAYWRGQL